MGLQEKKFRHTLETEIIPAINTALNELLGHPVTISIDWDSFPDMVTLQEIQYQILGRIEEAVRELCADDFAKKLVQEGFKAIKVKHVQTSSDKSIGFTDNTLSIQANWNDHFDIYTPGNIREAIENGL